MESVMIQKAREVVLKYINDNMNVGDKHIKYDDTYVVWFSKTLQNWKALISTTIPDGMYYEVTYNGSKKEIYLDAYKRWENIVIHIE